MPTGGEGGSADMHGERNGKAQVGARIGTHTTDTGGREPAAFLIELSGLEAEQCLERLESSPDGLDEGRVRERRRRYGANEVARGKQVRWPQQLLAAFNNPFSVLLIVLAALSFLSRDTAGGMLLSVMVALSSALRFLQEFRSGKAAERLRRSVTATAAVRRPLPDAATAGSGFREIALQALVPGDIVHLSAGDMVPADLRLLSAKDLFVNQAALTGEAFPVEKIAARISAPPADGALQLPNICFMGSNVVSGAATAIVAAIGADTYFGRLSGSLAAERPATEFDRGIERLSWLLVRFTLVMAPLVLLINGLGKHDWGQAFLFAIAVAVGLTPEMLPMIVTGTLARGAVAMSRRRVIVKRLAAIENFGAMDVLCTDKTGTLTQDRIILKRHVDAEGRDSAEVLEHAFLNSYYQTGLKNLLDVAILQDAEVAQRLNLAADYRLVDEIPFDFGRRRMSVVVSERGEHHELICKGAVEELLEVCTRARLGGAVVALDAALKQAVLGRAHAYNEDGLRVIAVAYKETLADRHVYSVADEQELVLLGFVAFLDPPKDSAGPAIAALRRGGVQVKILTGDSDVVARKLCRDVGLELPAVILGPELDAMDDTQLAQAAQRASLFARLSPDHKERIVRALRATGSVVGFLGDGINDAPALRAADIGISVDSAVDVAKESADIILLEKNLRVLEAGVLEGRKTFGNIVKYIKMAASSNFGNMFSVVGASLLLPFLPMLPLQILVQNLLYDLSQTAIPFDRVDDDWARAPRRWSVASIGRFMLLMGPVSSLFDYATFALMWFVFGASTPAQQALFQSGWFVESLVSQTLIVHVIRTGRIPFVQSRASPPLMWATFGVAVLALYLPFSPIAASLGLQALPAVYFVYLLALALGYALSAELLKRLLGSGGAPLRRGRHSRRSSTHKKSAARR
jgi:Mg2+-importing ATPase